MGRIHESRSVHDPIRGAPTGVELPRKAPGTQMPRAPEELAEEFPRVLDLGPLSRRRALARVCKRGPAEFRFVADED